MKKILFIDDDAATRQVGGLMLGDLGYDVILADGGENAIARLKANPVDLIFLDLMMPDIYGLTLLARIGPIIRSTKIPVILQTGVKNNDDIVKGYLLGISDVIFKPYGKQDLKHITEKWLSLSG